MTEELSFRLKKQKNGLLHFGEVLLSIEITNNGLLEIIENYTGRGWKGQGSLESITLEGYSNWKKGIIEGI